MILALTPIRGSSKTTIEVQGDTIIYDGVSTDFTSLLEGEQEEAVLPAIGTITRIDGEIHISLQWFYDNTGTRADRFPDVVSIINGLVVPTEKGVSL